MEKIKIAIIGFFAVMTSWLGTLAIPVYILVACNVIDYVTGITAACVRKEQVSSYKGILGIAKKVFMYLLVLVGVFVDFMLQYMFKNLNIPISLPFVVGCIVACWLVLNEMLSILENLNEIGVPMPPFLMPLVERIRGTVEKKGEDIKDNIGKKEDSSDE
jgi:toxin secretion/phage lysis holin